VRWAQGAAVLICVAAATTSACGVKRAIPVAVPPRILEAKTAGLDELLDLLRARSESIVSLVANSLRITFTSGMLESGRLEEYRSAPGYLLVARPARLRLNVQNPVTKTTILDMLSVGDDFAIWYPRENKFFTGRNSVKEFASDEETQADRFTARPAHLLEALLPQPLPVDDPEMRVALEERRDSEAKYYVLSLFREKGGRVLEPVRRVWIERSQLVPAKEEWFTPDGAQAGTVSCSRFAAVGGVMLPLSIVLERPADGYSIDLEVKEWKLNPDLPAAAFTMEPPAGARRVVLREKGTGKAGSWKTW